MQHKDIIWVEVDLDSWSWRAPVGGWGPWDPLQCICNWNDDDASPLTWTELWSHHSWINLTHLIHLTHLTCFT